MATRICQHCGNPISVDFGFHFDENLNLIHDKCEGVVFSTIASHDGLTSNSRYSCRGQNFPVGRTGLERFQHNPDIDT